VVIICTVLIEIDIIKIVIINCKVIEIKFILIMITHCLGRVYIYKIQTVHNEHKEFSTEHRETVNVINHLQSKHEIIHKIIKKKGKKNNKTICMLWGGVMD